MLSADLSCLNPWVKARRPLMFPTIGFPRLSVPGTTGSHQNTRMRPHRVYLSTETLFGN